MDDINLIIERYSLIEQWNIPLLLLLVVLTHYYFKLDRKYKNRFMSKRISFLIGVFLFYFIVGSPFHILTYDYLFSFKMIRESVLYFALPLLLVYSIPSEALQRMFWNYRFKRWFLRLSRPAFAMLLFYFAYSVYHIPSLFSFIMMTSFYNGMFEMLLFVLSIFMWWSIISPIPGVNYISDLQKAVFVLINSLLLFIPMYPLVFWEIPNYTFLGHQSLSISAQEDFKLGAIFVFMFQKVIICILFATIFYRWFKREDKIDPIDVSGALGVRDLTKKR